MEKTFFFNNKSGANLFGALHYPEGRSRHAGLVVCAPYAEEHHESYRLLVNWARFLAQHGFATLRFDFSGAGDSEGEWQDATINTWLSDIQSAIRFLQDELAPINVGLMGLRLGATLAAIIAEEIGDIAFLILWQPILDTKQYSYQSLRSNLTTQFILYNKVLFNREVLLHQLDQGQLVNLDGFLLSKAMHQSLTAIDLFSQKLRFHNPVFVADFEKNGNGSMVDQFIANYQSGNHRVQRLRFEVPDWWREPRPSELFDPNPIRLFQATCNWLINLSKA